MKKTLAILLLAAAIFTPNACGQGATDVVLAVEGVPPNVTDAHMPPSIRINTTSNQTISCHAEIEDRNGIKDLKQVTGVFWHIQNSTEYGEDDPKTHYTTQKFNLTKETNLSGHAAIFFDIQPAAVGGFWYCKIIARDTANLTGYNITSTLVYPKTCSNNFRDEDEELADCGGPCPACFNITAADASGVIGSIVEPEAVIDYRSSEESNVIQTETSNLTVTSANATTTGVGVIPASNIIIKNKNLSMPSQGQYDFPLEIMIPLGAMIGSYSGEITLELDTGPIVAIPVILQARLPNTPPEVRGIQVSPYPLILKENSSVKFYCNTTVYDINGFEDIARIEYSVAHNMRAAEDVAFLGSTLSKTSENTGHASGRFSMGPDAPPGPWVCTITATDELNTSGENSTTFQVHSASCENNILDVSEEFIDCGGICPPCLEGRDITVDLKGGTEVTAETIFYSRAPESLRITDIIVENLTAEDGSIIENNSIRVSPDRFVIEPKTRKSVQVTISVSEGLNKSEYVGNITVETNTTVEEKINVTGNMLYRGKGYLDFEITGGCVNTRLTQTVLDEYSIKSVEGAVVIIILDGEVIEELTTNTQGVSYFTPKKDGVYNLTVQKTGYKTESVLMDIVFCGIIPSCFDGVQNQGEDAVDCGGPCQPCHCKNGIADGDEEGVDCGGPCQPCHCINGIADSDEEGVDCGGRECMPCPQFETIPSLKIKHPLQATKNYFVLIRVLDDHGRETHALLTMEKPGGETIRAKTNRVGEYSLNVTEEGIWKITATRPGYIPSSSSMLVLDVITYEIARSYLMLLLFVVFAVWYIRRQRVLLVVDARTLKRLVVEEKIRNYKRVYITTNILEKTGEKIRSRKIKTISLSRGDETKAGTLSEDYGLSYDTAELLVLCKKIKAKKLLTEDDIPYEVHEKMRPLTITSLDEDYK